MRHFAAITLVLLSTAVSQISSYSSGAPSCNIKPGHGSQSGSVRVSVTSLGGKRWQVSVPGRFKGLILNSGSQGYWESPGRGFQVKGARCVTHSNSGQKSGPRFVFVSAGDQQPSFSGYLAYSRAQYAQLAF